MKKYIIISLFLAVVLLTGFYISKRYNILSQNVGQQLSWDVAFTGNTFTVDLQLTWNIDNITGEQIDSTEFEKYSTMIEQWFFVRKYSPPAQPVTNGSINYDEKSTLLNNYLKENNFYFRNSQKLTEGYLYIKLNKPLINGDIFLYFHDTNLNGYVVSGKVIKSKNLIPNTTQEYLYYLNDIDLRRFYDSKEINYNWLSNELNITNKLHFIWGYTTTSDWNYIKEFSIVWK